MPEKEISALPIFWRKKERRKEIILFTQKKKKKHIAGLSGSFISNCYQEQYFVES